MLRGGIGALCGQYRRWASGESSTGGNVYKDNPIGKPNGIYVNNQVELKSCQIFGFDYDYTLAEYKGKYFSKKNVE